MGNRMMRRHTPATIFMHWFNAACWIFLLATGIGLIKNDDLQPIGGWYADLMRSIFGGGANLLLAHEICGVIWAAGFLIFGLVGIRKYVIPFVREIATFSPSRDLMWLVTKGIQMTLGHKALATIARRFGFAARIPDQGFYNTGQKLFAVPSLLGGVVIAVTGVIMMLSTSVITDPTIVQWSILIHFVTVGLVFAGLLIHIYMASIAAGERPAFISMFTGTVPEDYAEHHHKLWYDEVTAASGKEASG